MVDEAVPEPNSISEAPSSCCSSLTRGIADYWACMAKFCSRTLDTFCEWVEDCWDTIGESCCGKAADNLSNQSVKTDSPQAQPLKVNGQCAPPSISDQTLAKQAISSPPQSTRRPTQASNGENTTVKSQTHAKASPEQHNNQAHQEREPPRIGFVETGSIFGDRKRGGVDNMMRLDNGRFASPGQPTLVQGPGGRTIRVSFVSGFPNIKSVESVQALKPVHSKSSRRSIESLKLSSTHKDANMSRESVRSNNSLEHPNGASYRLKKLLATKSVRSYKSSKSTESRGSEGKEKIDD